MKNLFKSLIVWLMFVAIPFQGFAAASMLTCAPMQASAPAAMPAGHCDSMKTAPHHAAAAGADATDQTFSQHHTGGKCNTCASCCFGAVMAPVSALVRVPGETCALADFVFQGIHVPTVDLDLPERPPKNSLT
ncbi:hypothetical protein [Massilia sp. S19_KUP03_FR1]|uniref:hypothetical protein n=1 Tax=Massilia sp. S19_KUP03_FR1 TaxID=3025503 RepID=UPI002FCDDE68